MSEEEINYWLEEFEDNRRMYMSKDHKILSFYETFKDMKKLKQENQQLKSVLKEIRECIEKSLINVGRNEDCFEYYLETTDIEKLLEIIDKGIGEDK